MCKQSLPESLTSHVNRNDRPTQITGPPSNDCVCLCVHTRQPLAVQTCQPFSALCVVAAVILIEHIHRHWMRTTPVHRRLRQFDPRLPSPSAALRYMLYVFDLFRQHLSIIPTRHHQRSSASSNSATSCSHNKGCCVRARVGSRKPRAQHRSHGQPARTQPRASRCEDARAHSCAVGREDITPARR